MEDNIEYKLLFTTTKGTGSSGEVGKELQTELQSYAHANNNELIELPYIAYRKGTGNDYPTIRFEYENISTGAKKTTREYTQNSDYKYFKVAIFTTGSQIKARFSLYDKDYKEISLSSSNKDKTLVSSANFQTHRFRVISYHSDYSNTENYEMVLPLKPERISFNAKRIVRKKYSHSISTKRQRIQSCKYSYNVNRAVVQDTILNGTEYLFTTARGTASTGEEGKELQSNFKSYAHVENNELIELPFIAYRKGKGNDFPTIRYEYEVMATGARKTATVYTQNGDYKYFKVGIYTSGTQIMARFSLYDGNGNEIWLSNSNKEKTLVSSANFQTHKLRVISYHSDYSATDNYGYILPPEPEHVREQFKTKRFIKAQHNGDKKLKRKIIKNVNYSYNVSRLTTNIYTVNHGTKRLITAKERKEIKAERKITKTIKEMVNLVRKTVTGAGNTAITNRIIRKSESGASRLKRLVRKEYSLAVGTRRQVGKKHNVSVETKRTIRRSYHLGVKTKRNIQQDHNVTVNTRRHIVATQEKVAYAYNTNRAVLKTVLYSQGTNRRVRVKTAFSVRLIRQIGVVGKITVKAKRKITKNIKEQNPAQRKVLANINIKAKTKRQIVKILATSSNEKTKRIIRATVSEEQKIKREIRKEARERANTRRKVLFSYGDCFNTQRLIIPHGIPVEYKFKMKRVVFNFVNTYTSYKPVRIVREPKEKDIITLVQAHIVKNDKGQSNIHYEEVKTIKGKYYPVKTALEATPVGLNDKVKYLLITKDNAVKSEHYLKLGDKLYAIEMITKYTNHKEVYLKEL